MLLPDVCDEIIAYILDPQERFMGIGDDILKAGIKGKTPVALTDADGTELNVLIPMVVAPGMGWHVYSVVETSTRMIVIRALFVVEISSFNPMEKGIVLLTRETRVANIQERHINSGGYAKTVPRMLMLMLGNPGRSTVPTKCQKNLEVPRVLGKTFGETSLLHSRQEQAIIHPLKASKINITLTSPKKLIHPVLLGDRCQV